MKQGRTKRHSHGRQAQRRIAAIATATIAVAVSSPFSHAADVSSVFRTGVQYAPWSGISHWTSTPSVGLIPNNGNGGLTFDVDVSSAKLDMDVTVEKATLADLKGSLHSLTANISANVTGLAGGVTLNIPSGSTLALSGTRITDSVINLYGTGTINGTATFTGTSSAMFVMPGATLQFGETSPTISVATNSPGITNSGLILVNQNLYANGIRNAADGIISGTSQLTINGAFTNQGTIDVRGLLVQNGAALLCGTISVSRTNGSGFMSVSGLTTFKDVTFDCRNTSHLNGTNVFASATMNGALDVHGTTLRIDSASTFNSKVNLGPMLGDSPTLSGTGVGSFADLVWYSGTIAGNVSIPTGGSLRVLSSGSSRFLAGGVIDIEGTMTVEGQTSIRNSGTADGRINIRGTGILDVLDKLTLSRNPSFTTGNVVLSNAGLIRTATGRPGVEFTSYTGNQGQWTFQNSGTVQVNSQFTIAGVDFVNTGLFDVRKVGMSIVPIGGTFGGSFILAAGTGVGFGGTNCTIGAISLTNAGTVAFFGTGNRFVTPLIIPGNVSFAYDGNLILDAPLTLPDTTTIDRSTLQGAFGITANNLTFKAGTVRTTITIPAGGTATLPATTTTRHLAGGTLILAGTSSWTAGKLYTTDAAIPATFDIRPGGFLSISGTTAAALNLASSTNATGLFRNSATVELAQNAAFSVSGGWTFENSGTVRLLSGASIALGGAGLLNSGVIDFAPDSSAALGRAANPIAIAEVRNQIQSGFNGGAWNGTGITAVALAGDTGSSLVCVAASDLLGLSGTSTATWQRQTVDATSVLVRYALNGDANLDGAVDKTDLDMIAPTFASVGTWLTGDFDSSGQFDFHDLLLLARNLSAGVPPAGTYDPAFESQLNLAVAQVPEPSTLALVALSGSLIVLRRTRSRRLPVAQN